MAVSNTSDRPTTRGSGCRAFTLVELLVVIAIIALLVSILMPSLMEARELAIRAACAAQCQALGRGLLTYASECDEWVVYANSAWQFDKIGHTAAGTPQRLGRLYAHTLKPGGSWYAYSSYNADGGYIPNEEMMYCPGRDYSGAEFPYDGKGGYWDQRCAGYCFRVPGQNGNTDIVGFRLQDADPSVRKKNPYLAWVACYRYNGNNPLEPPHRDDGLNTLFCDGSVLFLNRPEDGWGGFSWDPYNEAGNYNDYSPFWTKACEAFGA